MWHKLNGKLKSYVPLMIGIGVIVIAVDIVLVLLHRLLGVDKGTALYISILLLCASAYLIFYRQGITHHARQDNINPIEEPREE